MELEIKIKDKIKRVSLIEQEGNRYKIKIDDKIYDTDVLKTSAGVYSLIHKGVSYDIELSKPGITGKKYTLYNRNTFFNLQLIDAQTKYMKSRKAGGKDDDANVISTPMPGAVVKIPVKPGDKVKQGDVVIIVEAMKMQSEYKAGGDRTVKEILVEEGQSISGDQPLIVLE